MNSSFRALTPRTHGREFLLGQNARHAPRRKRVCVCCAKESCECTTGITERKRAPQRQEIKFTCVKAPTLARPIGALNGGVIFAKRAFRMMKDFFRAKSDERKKVADGMVT